MKRTFFILLIFCLYSCVSMQKPITPTISGYSNSKDFLKYKKIAVLPFVDAPNAPQSGQIVQGIVNQVLAKTGFEVAERARLIDILNEQKLATSGLIEGSKQLEIGKLLGVKAIVVGEVGQYYTQQRHTTSTTSYYNMPLYGGGSMIVPFTQQGQQWIENYISIALRILDVENGNLIYSGSGTYHKGVTNPHQQLAEYITEDLIADWFKCSGAIGFKYKYNEQIKMLISIVDIVYENSPAEKAGLKVGDQILKWNGKNLKTSFATLDLEDRSLICSNVGDKVVIDIKRNGQLLILEMVAGDRALVLP
ncbi:MAG: PDZ domain-containing protein [Nitrospiraceae bacterium]|nr:PDZ domain-containing protein [Nitrospiraceae bacterium]